MDYNYSEKIITNSYSIFSEKKELKIDLDLYRLNAFKNLSYSTKEDLYARMFLSATKK